MPLSGKEIAGIAGKVISGATKSPLRSRKKKGEQEGGAKTFVKGIGEVVAKLEKDRAEKLKQAAKGNGIKRRKADLGQKTGGGARRGFAKGV